jgi:hypothetical protein
VSGPRRTRGGDDNKHVRLRSENLKVRSRLEDLSVNRRIILEWM